MSVLGKRMREEPKRGDVLDKEECSTSPPKKKLKTMRISNGKSENEMDMDDPMEERMETVPKNTNPIASFEMQAVIDNQFKTITDDVLNDKWSVIYFYPHDFETVSTENLKCFNRKYSDFLSLNAQVIGISTESHYAHLAFTQSDLRSNFKICIASDLSTQVSADFGVLDQGCAKHSVFIISPQRSIVYSSKFPSNIGADILTEQLLVTLKALQSKTI